MKARTLSFLKRIPRFVLNYLKKIVHQKEINQILEENENLYGAEFCQDIINRFNIKVNSFRLENIPKDEGVIFVSNHPLGGMDAMAIVSEVNPIRSDITFIVNDLLMNLDNLKEMFVGVDKHRTNAKESLQKVNDLFASDKAVFLFPAGLVSRKKRGEIRDLEWKKTFVTRARKENKKIVPVYIDGKLSNFFYRLSNLRERLGIKLNIEMLYLANEMFKQKNKTLDLYIGQPLMTSDFDNSKSDKEIAEEIKNIAYNLPNSIQ